MTLVQSEPKAIKIWTTDFKAVYLWENKVRPSWPTYPTESIVYKMNADSNGRLYVPIWWSDSTWGKSATYSWEISVDWWAETTYSWTWSQNSSITLSGYTSWSSHTIMIKPTQESYQWARAFWWNWTAGRTYLTEILYDGSYMWYGISATNTWDYFRYLQYSGCTNLINSAEEYMPDTVTTIWERFRAYQYYNASKVLYSSEEALSSNISSINYYFRQNQYTWCSSLNEIKGWKDINANLVLSQYRYQQYHDCNTNKTVKVLSDVWTHADSTSLNHNYVTQVKVPNAYLNNYINTGYYPRTSFADSKFVWY